MGAILRLGLRLVVAPVVFVVLGLLGTLGFILNFKRSEFEEREPAAIEKSVENEFDENDDSERWWPRDMRHAQYKNNINHCASQNSLETAARLN
jgi:hypothetical protein